MRGLGGLLILLGLASIALNLFDTGFEMRFLMWIDQWGENIGWAIRGGAVVLGLILFMVGGSSSSSSD